MAGDGPLKDELIAAVAHEKLTAYFNIEGYVQDIPALLGASHCLLIPSKREGMPLVALEAGAAGVPIIATPVGNLTTLMKESKGYVRELHSFHDTLVKIMNHYGDALIIARNFMHTVYEEYSIEKCYERHLQVYWQK
jgi:glycosyltransferase involved in cell wall biosynthesis